MIADAGRSGYTAAEWSSFFLYCDYIDQIVFKTGSAEIERPEGQQSALPAQSICGKLTSELSILGFSPAD
jgi:hypothetical protein